MLNFRAEIDALERKAARLKAYSCDNGALLKWCGIDRPAELAQIERAIASLKRGNHR